MRPELRRISGGILIICSAIVGSGCSQLEDEDPSAEKPTTSSGGVIFSPSDFRYNPKVPSVSEEQVNERMLQSADFLFLTMPTASRAAMGQVQVRSLWNQSLFKDDRIRTQRDQRQGNCAAKVDRTQYMAQGNYLQLDIVQDNSRCAEFDPAVHTHKVLTAHYRISCSDTDLSVLNGESAAAIASLSLCPTDREFGQMSQIKLVASRGGAQVIISLGYMTDENGICRNLQNGDEVTAQACGQYYSVIQSNGTVKYLTQIDVLKASERQGVLGEYFYRSGDVSMQVNQWNGSLTYHEALSATGQADFPTYQLSSGAVTMSGEYPPLPEEEGNETMPEEEETGTEETPAPGPTNSPVPPKPQFP